MILPGKGLAAFTGSFRKSFTQVCQFIEKDVERFGENILICSEDMKNEKPVHTMSKGGCPMVPGIKMRIPIALGHG